MKRAVTLLLALLWTSAGVVAQPLLNGPDTSGIKGIHRVSLSVRNLDRAVRYYTQAIGLSEVQRYRVNDPVPVEERSRLKHTGRNVALLRGPNGQLELNEYDGAATQPTSIMPVPGPGITHVCYQAPAASDLYTKSKTAGGSIVSRGTAPVDRGYGIQYAYAKDPDGILYELERLDKPPFTDAVWLSHVALVTPDIDRLVGFYTNLLGVAPRRRMDNIRNSPKLDDIADIDSLHLRVAWFSVGNMTLEIWQFENPPTRAREVPLPITQIGYSKVSFEAADLNRLYKRLRAGGLSFLSPPVSANGTTTVLLRDPDGNLLSLEEAAGASIDRLNRPK